MKPQLKSLHTMALMLVTSLMLAGPLTVSAESQGNQHAMAGVENGDVLFDITLSEPRMLTGQMNVIRETYRDLQAHGITPRMVLAFHGQNVHYLTENLDTVALEDLNQVEAFNQSLDKLMTLEGVRIEVCAIATRVYGADRDAIRDGIEVVGNTYLSNIGYAKQGYAVIGIR
ncbi:MAG: DsrE family protein [Hydrogenovibrio sp.]|uniref:DsrE family protein n=1 Tax=Hydrogenovibrio sp. TaxID=2065821 RepID=UPI0028707A62|nr:DsrE family protein [Hydrogenovibrio sp.]MDR9498726.1 DsrE family protein [Hydrogenovibrio sp.]